MSFTLVSFALLLLGFLSITRAVAVRTRQTLGYRAIVDTDKGAFRRYNKAYHARGLLWCASFNEAMNGHLAEFVKSAHVLTALAVFALVGAAIPAALFLPPQSPTTKTEIIGPLKIVSPALDAGQKNLATLTERIGLSANDRMRQERLDANLASLRAKISEFGTQLSQISGGSAIDRRYEALQAKVDQLTNDVRELQKDLSRSPNGNGSNQSPKP